MEQTLLVTIGPLDASADWEKTNKIPTTSAASRVRIDFCAMMISKMVSIVSMTSCWRS